MPRKKKNEIEFKCNQCGKSQPRNDDMSNKNWDVYNAGEKCECGGKYIMFLDGEPIG